MRVRSWRAERRDASRRQSGLSVKRPDMQSVWTCAHVVPLVPDAQHVMNHYIRWVPCGLARALSWSSWKFKLIAVQLSMDECRDEAKLIAGVMKRARRDGSGGGSGGGAEGGIEIGRAEVSGAAGGAEVGRAELGRADGEVPGPRAPELATSSHRAARQLLTRTPLTPLSPPSPFLL